MTMTLKPWRQIATPRSDVLKGEVKQSEFAADLTKVRVGQAPPEYQDPKQFFQRTYLTRGMEMLLRTVAERIAGMGGEPVVQLQTAFGGGKTHSLLAVYHLARGEVSTSEMPGIPPILDGRVDVSDVLAERPTVQLSNRAIHDLPKARVVVLDGNNLAPSQPMPRGKLKVHTLWGELAWQLGGEDAYALVRASDENGTAPGKELLTQLISEHAPCVILMDELVAYYRQFEDGQQLSGGTFDTNISFIQQLTEALSAVPNAMLLASLPESEREAGGKRGEQALAALSYYLNRVQALWKPVTSKESFQIVRRRMFENISDQSAVASVCQAFADHYVQNGGEFPSETQMSLYVERMREEYPIHPEVFDRLYEDWSSLPDFQRTRGVLKFMAKAIHALWTQGNQDPLIMPGNMPFDDAATRDDLIYYLPAGWDPVVERDVEQEAARIENEEPRLGSVQACRRSTHTIFMGSAPGSVKSGIRGIDLQHVLLGMSIPGQPLSVYVDALRKLRDRLHYLNVDGDVGEERYWFDVRPNLRREMEERKKRFKDAEDIFPEVRRRLTEVLPRGGFGGVHVMTEHADIPDDVQLRLVVLPMDAPHHATVQENAKAVARAGNALRNRGNVPRSYQNRLIFLAPDANETGRLREHTLSYLAWQSIHKDVQDVKLNLDQLQARQARQSLDLAERVLRQAIRDTYKYVLIPSQDARPGKVDDLRWEHFKLSTTPGPLTGEVEKILKDNELVIDEWAPFHLKRQLDTWFWKDDRPAVKAWDVWETFSKQVYLPRLKHENVLKDTIQRGTSSREFFGIAQGMMDGKYSGFKFGESAMFTLDRDALLIAPGDAQSHLDTLIPPSPPEKPEHPGDGTTQLDGGDKKPSGDNRVTTLPDTKSTVIKRAYHASVELDPATATVQFAEIMQEVLQHLRALPGTKLSLTVEIQAEASDSFSDGVQRTVRENAKHLGFKTSTFE